MSLFRGTRGGQDRDRRRAGRVGRLAGLAIDHLDHTGSVSGNLEHQRPLRGPDLDHSFEHLLLVDCDQSRLLADPGASDSVFQYHMVALAMEAFPVCPVSGQGSVGDPVDTSQPRVAEAIFLGIGPAGCVGIAQLQVADDPWMCAVSAIQGNAVPVDQPSTGPEPGVPQCVGFE